MQLTGYVAAEQQNVTAVSLHPGIVPTHMNVESFRKFALDSPHLAGATAVWLCSEQARWLTGRFVNTNWDMEDLLDRKDEVLKEDLLKIDLKGRFGKNQFDEIKN